MDQLQTPLFDALEKFNKLTKVSYHVPGHKNGQVFLKEEANYIILCFQ